MKTNALAIALGLSLGLGHRHPLNYPFELRYGRDEAKRLGQAAAITGTITTPWRVVRVGRDLNTLVNSAILPNLSPPPDPRLFPDGIRTAWIQPGRAVWRYVDGGPGGVESMKEFSRMAGQLGFEHHVIKSIPAVWDTTIVLPGSGIGELAAYARRTGDTWFVAAMCGTRPKTFEAPLMFLDAGPYQVSIVRDGDSDTSVAVERTTRERGDSLRVELRAGGGFVARFTRN